MVVVAIPLAVHGGGVLAVPGRRILSIALWSGVGRSGSVGPIVARWRPICRGLMLVVRVVGGVKLGRLLLPVPVIQSFLLFITLVLIVKVCRSSSSVQATAQPFWRLLDPVLTAGTDRGRPLVLRRHREVVLLMSWQLLRRFRGTFRPWRNLTVLLRG